MAGFLAVLAGMAELAVGEVAAASGVVLPADGLGTIVLRRAGLGGARAVGEVVATVLRRGATKGLVAPVLVCLFGPFLVTGEILHPGRTDHMPGQLGAGSFGSTEAAIVRPPHVAVVLAV